ncbi:hypothetical protein JNB88_27220 [Rhizobium cauense]|uniref:hypothetical protein n=1 Tax=Rhizobium cauense TaxID=1166683 RepID=UPI001C6E2B0C|nr:hypothetical protein [Rhizobium cauense]MBW9117314.1 hypothetical protein [Rhizobium cauense]
MEILRLCTRLTLSKLLYSQFGVVPGIVSVRNRTGLENYAGDAYGEPERQYRRLIDTGKRHAHDYLTAVEVPV